MLYRYFYILFFTALVLTPSCKKDIDTADCRKLQNGMMSDNKDEVKAVITKIISTLTSDNYTEENLSKLAGAIGNECGMSANIYCFDCIQTMPSQSEIRLSFSNAGATVAKTIDLTYTTANKMVFANMHN